MLMVRFVKFMICKIMLNECWLVWWWRWEKMYKVLMIEVVLKNVIVNIVFEFVVKFIGIVKMKIYVYIRIKVM